MKDFKQKASTWYVPKINRRLIDNAMNSTNRYIQSMKKLDADAYVREALRVNSIAMHLESDFALQITPPEAHKLSLRINRYAEVEAKRDGLDFTPVDAKMVLAYFEKVRNIYRNLLLYFRGDDRTSYDLDKGIYIHGTTGSGKTLAMEVFRIYTSQHLQMNSFRKVQASDILDLTYKKGIDALDRYVRTSGSYIPINLYIEDFGAGAKRVKFMGNNIEPMGELIMRRYRYFEKYGTLTHVCTNIKPSDLANNFGPRVCSRFNKMFNIINMNIFDWRKI